MNNVCFGLMRTFGMAGLMVLGFGSLCAGNHLFGLGVDLSNLFMVDIKGKVLVLCIGSVLVGLLGLVLGQGIGASIPVRSRATCSAICILWHSGANANIVWFTLSLGSIGIQLGKNAAKMWIQSFGMWKLTLVLAVTALLAGWLTGVEHFVIGKRLAEAGKDEASVVAPWLLSLVTGVAAGVIQAGATGTNVWGGILTGVILPFGVVSLTNWTLGRDEQLRLLASRRTSGPLRKTS